MGTFFDPDWRTCPECGSDWRAGQIRPESAVKRYGHDAPCRAKEPWQLGRGEFSLLCTCPPRYYTRLIDVEVPRDGMSFWRCPDCLATWDRFTGELVL
jgi:ribosomal protein L37AE/L43A